MKGLLKRASAALRPKRSADLPTLAQYFEVVDRLALLGSAVDEAGRLGLIVGPDFSDNAEDGKKVRAKFELGKELAMTRAFFNSPTTPPILRPIDTTKDTQ